MTRDIDDLIQALDDATPAPDAQKRDAHHRLAMAAFDSQAARDARRAPRSLFKRLFRPAVLMPGGLVMASLAALLLVVNVDEVSRPPEAGLGTSKTADFILSEPLARSDTADMQTPAPAQEPGFAMADEAAEDEASAPPAPAFIGGPDVIEGDVSGLVAPEAESRMLEAAPAARAIQSLAESAAPDTVDIAADPQFLSLAGPAADISLRVTGLVMFPVVVTLTPTTCPTAATCAASEAQAGEMSEDGTITLRGAIVCRGAAVGMSATFTAVLTDAAGKRSDPIEIAVTCQE